jgi:argininosuccinate lyase
VLVLHTHTQRAQPSTVAHYLLAVVEQLERDGVRLRAAFESTNRNPLGACAITGTGFPIDRRLTSALLGFSGPTGNTYGSIATVDYLLESVSAASVLLTGNGRFVQDMLLWSTGEFGYLRLGDGFVQGTASAAQAGRSPSARARSAGHSAIRRSLSPHSFCSRHRDDAEDDLHRCCRDVPRRDPHRLVAAALPGEFDAAAQACAAPAATLTELADALRGARLRSEGARDRGAE